MADAVAILGQVSPSATTNTTLYSPSSVDGIVSAVYIANRSATATSFRLGVDANAGTAPGNGEWLFYDQPIGGLETIVTGRGLIIPDAAELVCYATLATLAFQAFGVERS